MRKGDLEGRVVSLFPGGGALVDCGEDGGDVFAPQESLVVDVHIGWNVLIETDPNTGHVLRVSPRSSEVIGTVTGIDASSNVQYQIVRCDGAPMLVPMKFAYAKGATIRPGTRVKVTFDKKGISSICAY